MSDIILPPDEGVDLSQQTKPLTGTGVVLPPVYDPTALLNAQDAVATNPDEYAQAKRVSEQLALPLPTVQRNFKSLDNEQKVNAMRYRMASDPFYADQMRNPDFAKMSQGDEEALAGIRDSIKASPAAPRTMSNYAGGIASSFIQGGVQVREGVRRMFADLIGSPEMSAEASRLGNASESRQALATPEHKAWWEGDLYGGIVSTVSTIPAVALTFANLPLGLTAMGLQQAAPSYNKYRDRGASPMVAALGAGLEGIAEAGFEAMPMGFAVKNLGKIGMAPFLAGLMGREMATEIATTIAQTATDTAIANPDKTWGQWASELPANIRSTVVGVLVQSGAFAGAHGAVKYLGTNEQAKETADRNAEALRAVLLNAANSKLLERSPTTFTQFVNAASANGPLEAVYIDGAMFAQAAKQAGVDLTKTMPETAAALDDAVATKSDVRIPLGEFAANATLFQPSVIEQLKSDPNGATQAEIKDKAWAEETKAQTEKIMAALDFTDAWKQSAETVKTELKTQLTQANRFTSDVNDAYAGWLAAFYATQAHNLGITPQEMYARYPLQAQAQSVVAPNTLNQPLDPMLNVGLDIGDQKDALPVQYVREALKALGVRAIQISVHRSDTENTAVITLDRELSAQKLNALAVATKQGAISQYTSKGGMLEGPAAADWGGKFLPDLFLLHDGKPAADKNGVYRQEALQKAVPQHGRVTPNSISVLAVHFSPRANMRFIDTNHYGQGMKGAEATRVNAHPDSRIAKRLHFYVPQGRGVHPESGVGNNAYAVTLNNLYDTDADPLHLVGKNGDTEVAVADAGFAGYYTRGFDNRQGAVVLVGPQSVAVQALGNAREANTAIGNVTTPAPLLSPARVLADALVQDKRLPSGQMTPVEWKASIAHNAPDLAAKLPDSLFTGTEPVYRDQLARPLYGGEMFQGEVSSEWYYSELARQIDVSQMKIAPPKGWKDFVRGLASKGVKQGEIDASGINDWLDLESEQARLEPFAVMDDTGIVGRYPDAESAQAEADKIKAERGTLFVNDQSFRDFARDMVEPIVVVKVHSAIKTTTNPDGSANLDAAEAKITKAFSRARVELRQQATKLLDAVRGFPLQVRAGADSNVRVETVPPVKLTKVQVQEFLRDHGVKLDETILSADNENAAQEVEYNEGEWETDEPDEDWLAESAGERLDEYVQEKVDELMKEDDSLTEEQAREQIDEDAALEELIDRERQQYWDDSESPRSMSVEVTNGDESHSYNVHESYGEVYVSDERGREVRVTRGDYESAIREHAGEYYDMYPREGEAETQYQDYNPFSPNGSGRDGNFGYVELLMTLPGKKLFTAPHFGDSGADRNLLAHARVDFVLSDTETRPGDPNAKLQTMRVREIQADWAQQGREEGFVGKWYVTHSQNNERVVDAVFDNEADAEASRKALIEKNAVGELHYSVGEGTVEPAPFVTSTDAWTSLVWKRLIRYAAENGADRVVWSRGDQQVEQWAGGLRKRVDTIEWIKTKEGVQLLGFKKGEGNSGHWYVNGNTEDGFEIRDNNGHRIQGFTEHEAAYEAATAKNNESVAKGRKVVDTTYAESALSDAIGKAMGRQILNDPAQTGVIEGSDITIDSIGMSQFYGDASGKKGDGNDAMLTKVANQVLKKLGGGKVQEFASGEPAPVVYAYEGPNLSIEDLKAARGDATTPADELLSRAVGIMEHDGRTFADIVNTTIRSHPERKGEVVAMLNQPGIGGKLVKQESQTPGNPGFEMTPALKAKALAGLPLFQGNRGQISFANDIKTTPTVLTLLANADLSTFLHETGHFYLEVMADMAAQPDAPAQTVKDFATILNWFGVTSEQWHAMTLDEKRPYHEQWARGMEVYLFEGKSPSLELQSLFSRFRAWMINVYQQITKLNVDLTPEVRGVMDRLVATNEQILQAEATRAFAPMFETKPPGMSDAEWVEYQKTDPLATQEAVDQLQTRSLRDMQYASNAKAAVLKRLQQQAAEKRKGVRAEVAAEVNAEPIYQAMHFLKTGEYAGESAGTYTTHRLDIPSLREMYPENMPNRPDLTNLIPYTGKEGLPPNTVAEMFGFGSGDELVRTLLNTEQPRQKIDGITDQRMLERYGDLADPASMEKAANAAVHNDVRAKFVATELRMLEKAVGKHPTLMAAAREFAATLIARKKVRMIKPNVYVAAEARAARNAQAALTKDDLVLAATEKRNQLVNLYAAKAAHAGLDEVAKIISYAKRVADSKTIDPEYRAQISALLERFDLHEVSARDVAKRQSLVQWIEAQRAANMEPVIDPTLENEALRKPYQEMTLEELRGLYDSVRNIEHLGRLKHKLLTLADQREFKLVVESVRQSIEANAKRTLATKLETNTLKDHLKKGVTEYFAMHRKFANIMREMDGYNDNGILQKLFVHTSNLAGANEAVMHEAATIKLSELMKPIFASGKLNVKQFIPEINAALSREGRIMVALNTGNEGNLQRLMDGDHWTMPQVQAVVDTLTKQEMDFVQAVWNYVGTYRDAIGVQQKRLTGLEPKWVEPRQVVTQHGVYAGGYIPAKYDTARSTRALSDEAAAGLMDAWRAARGAAQTSRSFTKERANKVVDRPLRKDFGVITQHITEVTHRLAWQDWLVDTNRLLRAGAIDGAIRDHYGPEILGTLRDAVEDIAIGNIGAQNAFERGINYLRTGATIAGLGWRITTSLLQPIGLTQSMVRIGPKWVGKGLVEWLGDAAHMENTAKRINDKSDFMRLRAKTMQREISEIRDQVSGKNSKIEASYFYLIQKLQLVADIPTWLGQYSKAIDIGTDEATAVAQADQAVIDAQGSGQIKDLSAIQRGGPLLKLFTNFYSFFNTTYNLTSEAVGRTDFKSPGQIGMLAVDFLLLYSLPAALGTLMKFALGDDDPDKLARNLIADQLGYLFGTMVGLREVAGVGRTALGLPGDYTGPASLRVFSAATSLGKQISQGEADEPFWKALNNVAGILFHYPAGQINATADGIVKLADGKTTNPGVLAVGSSKK